MNESYKKIFLTAALSALLAFGGAWWQVNSRIAVLEVQVANDHETMLENNKNIDEIKTMLVDIQKGVQHLQDVKEDKK